MQIRHPARDFFLLLITSMLLFVNVQAGDLTDIKDTVKKSYKVRPGGTLFLEIDHGNVEVKSHSGNEVRIEIERTVSSDNRDEAKQALERHDLTLEERSNNVYIESRYDKNDGFWRMMSSKHKLDVLVKVSIPREYNVDFQTGAGNFEAGDFAGQVHGVTGAGNITIGAVDGRVDVSSGSGNIDIEGVFGRLEANTGAGNVQARDVRGVAEINTGAGNIEAYITRQPNEGSSFHTGAGNVTVYLGSGVGVTVDAEAAVGSASSDYSLSIEGKWMKKSFSGDVNGGGPELELRVGVGNVALKKM